MQTYNLFEQGFRFYHDPSLHYEITAENTVKFDQTTGKAILYLGMRDYLKDGTRMRKTIRFTAGPPILFMSPHDSNADIKWDGVVNIEWERKGIYGSYSQNCISDAEKISDHYNPNTAVTNDNTVIRTAFVFAYDSNAKYLIKRDGAADRTVSAYNTTSVVLNQNEYICSVISSGNHLMRELKSGTENALKISITYDLAYDFTSDARGVSLYTMSDTIARAIEEEI